MTGSSPVLAPKRLDAEGRCCATSPMRFDRRKPFCPVCYAEFGPDGAQKPNWAWRAVDGGFEANPQAGRAA